MINKVFLWCSVLFLLASCKAKVPEDVVDKDTMEDLLYDYHLAQALAKRSGDSVDYRTRLYTDAVFRKYGINEDEFNHTMEWYTRNSEELFKIYKKIDDKYTSVTFANKNSGNRYADMRAEGDTMNLWRGNNFYLLTSNWRNRMDFTLETDSTYQKGDRLMWQFDTQWFYRERDKSAFAQLAVVYENDSVGSSSTTLVSAGRNDVYIKIGEKPVKSVQGFVYMQTEWNEQPRILVISEPVLVRFKKKKVVVDPLPSDSLSKDSAAVENSSIKPSELSTEERKRGMKPIEPKAREANNPRMLRFPKTTD